MAGAPRGGPGIAFAVLVALTAVATVPAGFLSAQAEWPLPAAEPFYAATRANLDRSQQVAAAYAYHERRTELHLNPFGRLGSGEVRAYDVTPSPDGKEVSRRLVERDGRAVTDGAIERAAVRERRPRPGRRSASEDVVAVLDFVMERREVVHERPMIVIRFRPKPNARAETRQGRLVRAFTGVIWVDEADREVLRVEGVAADDMSYGFGMVARLNKGTTVTLTRAAVGTTWLPTSIRFTGEGRAMLFRRLTVDHTIEWSRYRRVVASRGD